MANHLVPYSAVKDSPRSPPPLDDDDGTSTVGPGYIAGDGTRSVDGLWWTENLKTDESRSRADKFIHFLRLGLLLCFRCSHYSLRENCVEHLKCDNCGFILHAQFDVRTIISRIKNLLSAHKQFCQYKLPRVGSEGGDHGIFIICPCCPMQLGDIFKFYCSDDE
jgi:hypothetical protein